MAANDLRDGRIAIRINLRRHLMESPKFSLGMIIAALTYAFVMGNLWLWNIVPLATMRAWERDPHHEFIIVGIALAAMFGGGYLSTAIADGKTK